MILNPGKISLLHVAKQKLGMDDAAYRELLHEVAGVESAKELDVAGFEAVLERLKTLGFRTRRDERGYGKRPAMATPAQLEYIRGLWRQYTGREDETSLNHWLEHKFGVTALRFADTHTAGQALTALKAMTSRRAHRGNS